MKKLIAAFCLLIPTFAFAGTCPSAAQYINPLNPTGALVTLASLGVTNCFYFAANGSDSNAGDSEASGHPWLHAPQMPNATGNAAAHTPAPGDGFIVRGGDTYHYFSGSPQVGLPSGWPTGANGYAWRMTHSGTASQLIYWGVDEGWFTGASWVQPIFTNDNPNFLPPSPNAFDGLSTAVSSCAFPQGNLDDIAATGPSYYIIDNFHFTGMCWNDQSSNSSQSGLNEHNYIKHYQGGGSGTNPYWFINILMDGWSHTPGECPAVTASNLVAAGTGYRLNDTFWITGNVADNGVNPQGIVTGIVGGGSGPGAVASYTLTYPGTGIPGIGISLPHTFSTAAFGSQPTSGTGMTIQVTTAAVTGACGGPGGYYGSTNGTNRATFFFDICDGAGNSDDLSFECIQNDAYEVGYSVMRHFAGTQILNDCHNIHDNLFEFINNDNTSNLHTDMWFCNGETQANNFFAGNLVRHIGTEYSQAALSAVFWFNPFATDALFNNVWYDINCSGDCQNVGQKLSNGSPCCTGTTLAVYNNTFESNNAANVIFENQTFAFAGAITSQNNHWITDNASTSCAKVFTTASQVNSGGACSGDIFQTHAVAAGGTQGYTASNNYAPGFATGATVGACTNENSLGSTFGTSYLSSTSAGVAYNATTKVITWPNTPLNTRPLIANYDCGAYQFSSAGTVANPTFSPVAGTYTSAQSVALSTTTTGATICYTVNGSTPTAATAGTCDSNGGVEFTYTVPISVAVTTTIKALGTLSGDTNSSVVSALYTINLPAVTNGIAFPIGVPF
jgi:hypothetical protein